MDWAILPGVPFRTRYLLVFRTEVAFSDEEVALVDRAVQETQEDKALMTSWSLSGIYEAVHELRLPLSEPIRWIGLRWPNVFEKKIGSTLTSS